MRENWEIKKFSDCLQKVSNTAKIPKKKFLFEGSYPIVSQEASFVNGYWDNKDDLLIVDKPIVVFGDHTKVIKYVDFSFVRGADGVKVLLPVDEIDSKFFSYQLRSIKLRDLGYARHFRLLKEKSIQIPPLDEQKEIVEILDKTFESIKKAKANIEKNIENAKELFQSKLNQIFSQTGEGWEEKNIGESCEIIMGQSPKGSSYNSDGIGTPLINGPVEFGINPFSKTVMTKWTTDPKKMCKKGDLILCVRGSTTGRINIAGFDSCIGRGVAAIRYNRNQKWINYFVRNNRMKIHELGTGSTFPNISSKTISDLSFSQPISIKKQDELVETLDIIDNHIESVLLAYKEELKNLEELKKSILQKAFSGELTNKNKAA
jgi:type I restriction enzyme, S subunit